MRVAIVTAIRHGLASHCLPALVERQGVEVVAVIFCEGHYKSRRTHIRRKLKKMAQIGPLGALAGIWLRRFYTGPPVDDLLEVASRQGLRVDRSPRTNARETRELLETSKADLALSLGNSYIAPRVFRTPRLGMINVHGEILPRFQGASSVIWAIHDGVRETGFTIHRVDKGIDTGAILYQERFPIEFAASFGETVRRNVAEITRRIPPALARVVADYETYLSRGEIQKGGGSYTTPTLRQLLHMFRQHRRMRSGAPVSRLSG